MKKCTKMDGQNLSAMSYKNLIDKRNLLINNILQFEKKTDKESDEKENYRCDLLELAKICESLSEIYEDEDRKKEDTDWVYQLKDFLEKQEIPVICSVKKVIERKNGKKFTLSEHVEGLIYSLLSNQREWKKIDENTNQIEEIFFSFDVGKIKNTDPSYFVQALRKIKCGNRDLQKQMNSLLYNISIMEKIELQYGSMDAFLTSESEHIIVKKLSDPASEYKLQRVGEALAWEYMRNVGIDGCKPDLHVCRFLGSERMGYGKKVKADPEEVYEAIEQISKKTGFLKTKIDALIWAFCSKGNGEICSAHPKCYCCPIRKHCKRKI